MAIFNPCRDCAERRVGCHSACEVYKRYTEELNALKERIRAENECELYEKELHSKRGWTELVRQEKRRQKD